VHHLLEDRLDFVGRMSIIGLCQIVGRQKGGHDGTPKTTTR